MNKITVVIPTYNRDEETKHAILSVGNIADIVDRIVVVDDASKNIFQYNDINVTIIRLSENKGPGLARKVGVDYAKTKLIAFLDSDDRYEQDWLTTIEYISVNLIDINHSMIVGTTIGMPRYMNKIINCLSYLAPSLRILLTRIILCFFNFISTPSVVISKEICRFPENIRYCEDYFTYVYAALSAHEIFMLKTNASSVGRAPKSIGGLSNQRAKMIEGELLVKKWIIENKNINLIYRIFAVIGMIYTFLRCVIKDEYSIFKKCLQFIRKERLNIE